MTECSHQLEIPERVVPLTAQRGRLRGVRTDRGTRRRLAGAVVSMLLGACLLSACGGNGTSTAQGPSWENACATAPLNGPQPKCTPTLTNHTGPQGTSTTPPSGSCPPECDLNWDHGRDVVVGKP